MHTVVIGVRHRSAPIEIREKLAFAPEEVPGALKQMVAMPGIVEGAILSTCNRSEVYATVTDTALGMRSIKAFLQESRGFDTQEHLEHTFCLLHEDALMHLFRVTSGLDSMVLGEDQILGQVKETLKTAIKAQTSGEFLDKIFKTALTIGKAVRTETGIAQRDVSMSHAAVSLVESMHPEALEGHVTILGAGRMAEILLSVLGQPHPTRKITLINRTKEAGETLAGPYGVDCDDWDSLQDALDKSHAIFVATASPHLLISTHHLSKEMHHRVVVDIAVPRNVDPEVEALPGVTLFNADQLGSDTSEGRLALIQDAHRIIEREYQKYTQWLVGRSAAPVITNLRARVEDMRRSEVAEIEAYCPHVKKKCSVIDDLSRALVNKILHDPTVSMRSTPELEEIFAHAESLSRLFNLPPAPCGTSPDTLDYHLSSERVLTPHG